MGEVGKNEQGWIDLCQELQRQSERNDTEVTEKVKCRRVTSTLRNTCGRGAAPTKNKQAYQDQGPAQGLRPGLNPDSDHRLTPDPAYGLGPPLARG